MDEDFEFEDKEELENGIDNEKHWKSLGIASAVISVICTVIIFAILILTPSNNEGEHLQAYTLAEVVSKKIIQGHRFNGSWISGHEFLYQSADKNIMIYDCNHGQSKPITNKLNTTNNEIVHFEMSPTRTHLLIISTNPELQSKRQENLECDPTLEYYVYDLAKENMISLKDEFQTMLKRYQNMKLPSSTRNHNNGYDDDSSMITSMCVIQSSQWNPFGNILLILHHNDIYWMDMDNNTQSFLQLTSDGSIKHSIYNGFNDYIYRDFIFEKPTSIWWSSTHPSSVNGQNYYLCYLQINNSQVPLYSIPLYENDDSTKQYYHYRYSTINSSIGNANLWIMEIQQQFVSGINRHEPIDKAVRIKPPDKLNHQEHYVVHVNWISNKHLIVLWTFRDQKRSILGSCEAVNNWQCEELVSLRNWLRMNHVPQSILPAKQSSSSDETNEFFFCGQIPENSVKTFHQLYSFNAKSKVINSYLNTVENGPDLMHYQIIELLGYNQPAKLIFFIGQSLNQSNDENSVSEQDMRINLFVYSINFSSVHCLTCQLVKCFQTKRTNESLVCINLKHSATINEKDTDEESCLLKRVHFSPNAEYAIITCLIGIVPKVYLVKFTTVSKVNLSESSLDLVKNITLFEDNSDLEDRVQSKMMPNVESYIFTRENDDLVKYLRIKLMTPQDFDNEEIGKYPFLFEMYSPKYQFHYLTDETNIQKRVFHTETYPNIEWAVHMVTEHDFVYAWLDGQYYQDNNHSIREISFSELIDDYSTLIDFIQSNLTFVNSGQSCLIGNNVGAFFVLNSLATSSIECGIAISPLVDWNQINSFIAEQYLDLKRVKSNDLQYLLKMTLNHKMLGNKNLLIIHGTSNEMFPVSQTMKLVKSLTFDEQNRYMKQNLAIKDQYELNWTNHHFMELYVDEGNSFDNIIEHFYRKIEFFLFQWIIV